MLIKLVIDIWRDVFDWLTVADRKHLARISGFGDREFSGICQKWLHEWTKLVCLGLINIASPPPVELMPEVEMPANIRDFKEIRIRHLDTNVLHFLRGMQPLFHAVNLNIYYCNYNMGSSLSEATRTVLDHLFPLLTRGIETVYLSDRQLLFTIRERFPVQFLSIKRLDVNRTHPTGIISGEMIALFLSWLGTSRADGQPRVLIFHNFYGNTLEFVQRIQQQFLDKNMASASSFYICIFREHQHQQSTTQNATTKEQLVVKQHWNALHIGRCSAELDGQKWVDEMDKQRIGAYRQAVLRRMITITISSPTFGQMQN